MMAATKILLVDDEVLVREELGAILQDEGYAVTIGADGEEGLSLFHSTLPDMVITDVRMPRRDGLSLAMTIRQENPHIPVTIITGHGTEAMAIRALRAGVTDFIKKPVRLEGLLTALVRMEAARKLKDLRFTELPPSIQLVQHEWTYLLHNNLEAIPPFVDIMLKRSADGMSRSAMQELSLALRELLINAVEHGNLGISFEEKTEAIEEGILEMLHRERAQMADQEGRQIQVIASRRDQRLVVEIIDEGQGFDWRSLPDPTDTEHLLSSHGRGVLLAHLSTDSLTFNETGNSVKVEKRIKPD